MTRPEVPVEVLGRLLPDVDTRSRAVPGSSPASVAPPPPPASAPMVMRSALPMPDQAIAMAKAAEPTAVQEGTTETVFALPNPIDLAAGHSASVPILDVEVPASLVALATPGQPPPLAAIRVVNDSPRASGRGADALRRVR